MLLRVCLAEVVMRVVKAALSKEIPAQNHYSSPKSIELYLFRHHDEITVDGVWGSAIASFAPSPDEFLECIKQEKY